MSQKKTWTTAEDATLRRYYPTKGRGHCAKLIGCTVAQVQCRAGRLGILRIRPVMERKQRSELCPLGFRRVPTVWAPPARYSSVWAMAQGVQA